MKVIAQWTAIGFAIGHTLIPWSANAEAPGWGWFQRVIDSSVSGCLSYSADLLKEEGLTNIERDNNDVAGYSKNSTVAMVCSTVDRETVLTVFLAGSDVKELQKYQENLIKKIDSP